MKRATHISPRLAAAALSLLFGFGGVAQAQLPGLPRPDLPVGLPDVEPRRLPVDAPVDTLMDTRAVRVDRLLKANRAVLERGPGGEPVVRGRIVAVGVTQEDAARLEAEGLRVVGRRALEALELDIVEFALPPKASTRRSLRRLRKQWPGIEFDYNHVYLQAGETPSREPGISYVDTEPADIPRPPALRVGLVDAGVDTSHPVFAGVDMAHWGCGDRAVPSAHGTAVASILVARSAAFSGVVPGASLYAADAWCGEATGGNAISIVGALDWLVQNGVQVINLSLVGGDNGLLRRAVQRVAAAGTTMVAAVGNDGPSSGPLYPAAYPEVVAVTGVNAKRRVLPEASRGDHVDFAAPGADMVAAGLDQSFIDVRGTSFAAPVVSGLIALRASAADVDNDSVAALAREAIDLGRKGRDRIYGHGLVGDRYRVAGIR